MLGILPSRTITSGSKIPIITAISRRAFGLQTYFSPLYVMGVLRSLRMLIALTILR